MRIFPAANDSSRYPSPAGTAPSAYDCGELRGTIQLPPPQSDTGHDAIARWQITIVIPFLPGGNITTSTVSKGKINTPRVITSHYSEGGFIYFLNRPRGIFANVSKCQ